ERFLRRHGDVGGLWRIQAEVALAAGADCGLAEIAAHGGRAAARTIEHRIELAYLARLHGLDRTVDLPTADTAQCPAEVRAGIEGDPLRGGSIAPGTANLLPVGLDRCGRIGVDDEANVWFVDTHAEGDGRHHHCSLGLQELVEPSRAHVTI